jgi:WD40 repeat protein
MTAVAFTDAAPSLLPINDKNVKGLPITGSENGSIYVWTKDPMNVMDLIPNAHSGPIFSIASIIDRFATCGGDGRVRTWTNALTPLLTMDICAILSSTISCRAIGYRQGRIMVGTDSNDVVEIDEDSRDFARIVSGHVSGAIKDIVGHPTKPLFLTTGEDCTVREWDVIEHRDLRSFQIPSPGLTINVSTDVKLVAVGMQDGSWAAYKYATFEEVAQRSCRFNAQGFHGEGPKERSVVRQVQPKLPLPCCWQC